MILFYLRYSIVGSLFLGLTYLRINLTYKFVTILFIFCCSINPLRAWISFLCTPRQHCSHNSQSQHAYTAYKIPKCCITWTRKHFFNVQLAIADDILYDT